MQGLGGSRWQSPLMATQTPPSHFGGRKLGRWHVSCYQFADGSNSAESLVLEGGGLWRWLAVEKLAKGSCVWAHGIQSPGSKRQTCIDEIDFDFDAQLGGDPQKGQ